MTAAGERRVSQWSLLPFKSREWAYVLLTISAFVFSQGFGRVVSWRLHHNITSLFVVIPLVFLCPIAIMIFRRRRRLQNKAVSLIMLLWAVGFGYATFVATAHGSILAAVYTAGQFCLPATICLWLLTRDEMPEVAHARLAKSLLFLGAIAGLYGIVQYVFAPPWDTAWLQDINDDSFGTPERFGIRVFGTLNSPGTFAIFMASTILLSLPYIRVRNVSTLIALLLMGVALLLSLVRTAWLAVALGTVIYILLTPNRRQAIMGLVTVGTVCLLGLVALIFAVPNAQIGDKITQRFETLSNAQEDASVKDRKATAALALQHGLENPAGGGLGILSKLGNGNDKLFSDVPASPIDNGFVARFFEMGVIGFMAFFIAGCVSIVVVVRAYLYYARKRYQPGMVLGASCVAAEVVIFGMNASGDDQLGIIGVIFFAALALPLMRAGQRPLPEVGTVASLPSRKVARSRRALMNYRAN